MIEAMTKNFPPEVKFTRPTGGLFLWVELPEKINTMELLPKAIEKDVAYIPGSAFYPDGGGHNTLCASISPTLPMRKSKRVFVVWRMYSRGSG
jgi:2-aminoadipate transaminase